jgi:hypothetical protein
MPKMFMPNIDDFPDAPDALVPGDYVIRVTAYELKTASDGRSFFKLSGSLESGPLAHSKSGDPIDYAGRPYSFTVWPPSDHDPPDYADGVKRKFKAFMVAGNVPWDDEGFDPDDFVGCTWGIVLGPQKKNPDFMEVKKFFAV